MAKKPAVTNRPNSIVSEAAPAQTKNGLFASRGGKIFLGVLLFALVFTLGYGVWRLSGGSFKPKTTCPDSAAEVRLRDKAAASSSDFAAQLEYANYEYSQCKNFDLARDNFQKAVTLAEQPGSPVQAADKTKAYLGLGLAYFYKGDSAPQAQAQFKKAIALEPQNSLGLYMLASTLRQSDPAQALNLFKQVAELDPAGALGQDAQKSVAELAKKS